MLQILVVGAGGYAGYMLERLWELPERCRVLGVCERPGRQSESLERIRGREIPVFCDLEAMLEAMDGQADAVLVATGIASHAEITEQCLRAGLDVLLEKPPVACVQDLDRLRGVLRETGRRVAVNFQYLFAPMPRALQARIQSGQWGRLLSVRSMGSWPRPASYFNRSDWSGKLRHEGKWVLDGSLNNPFAHLLAQNLFLAASRPGEMAIPENIEAEFYHANSIEAEDTSCVRISCKGGVSLTQALTLNSACIGVPRTLIELEKARVEVNGFHNYTAWPAGGGEPECFAGPAEDDRADRQRMLENCLDSLGRGEDFLVDLETVRPFVVAVNGAFESSGPPRAIPAGQLRWIEQDGERQATVEGLPAALEQSLAEGRMLHQTGLSWARRGERVDLRSYDFFPIGEPWREWLEAREMEAETPRRDRAAASGISRNGSEY